jgi:hypothetical protein
MKSPVDQTRGELQERCSSLIERVRLLRDYATTPGDVWLARGELNRIQELAAEIEQLLAKINTQEEG